MVARVAKKQNDPLCLFLSSSPFNFQKHSDIFLSAEGEEGEEGYQGFLPLCG